VLDFLGTSIKHAFFNEQVRFSKPPHLPPWLGVGYIAKQGDGFRYFPAAMQLVLQGGPGMTLFIHSDEDLCAEIISLVAADVRLRGVLDRAGMPKLRRRAAGFSGLCAIICAQQLSTASASAIWTRLSGAFDPFHPEKVRRAPAAKLARLGLSKPKIKTV